MKPYPTCLNSFLYTFRVKIIDDDIDLSQITTLEEAADLLNTNEDAPQVVGVIDERPLHLRIDDYRKSELWKPLGAEDDNGNINVREKQDNSPPRPRINLNVGQKSQEEGTSKNKYDKNQREPYSSPPRRKRSDDYSPPRKQTIDNSPLRRKKHDDSSHERNRKRQNSDERSRDRSLPRKYSRDSDNTPPRKKQNDDNTPPRRNRRGSDSSPPRKKLNDDYSPPRRSRRGSDSSPPRKKQNDDNTPPRRNRRDSDNSPPRKKQTDNRKDLYSSPPRKRKTDDSTSKSRWDSSSSPPRRKYDDDNSPPRKNHRNSDNSPPRKNIRDSKQRDFPSSSSSKPVEEQKRKLLPGDKKGKYLIPAKRDQRMTKTLDGRNAGLQSAQELVKENEAFRKREDALFKNMSVEMSGVNAAPVMRDKTTGKIRDLQKEAEEQREKDKKEEENKVKYSRWGRGLKQVEDYEEKLAQDLHEMSKPLARYADDEDLEKYLKEQEREGDPMLDYIRKKKKKKVIESGKPRK